MDFSEILRTYIAKEKINLKEGAIRLNVCYGYFRKLIKGNASPSIYIRDRMDMLLQEQKGKKG